MCAKLRTAAASNNRDHQTRSLYYCLFGPRKYIFVLRAHPVRGESHNQRNTTREVATVRGTQGRSQTFSFGGATGGASFATRGAVDGL